MSAGPYGIPATIRETGQPATVSPPLWGSPVAQLLYHNHDFADRARAFAWNKVGPTPQKDNGSNFPFSPAGTTTPRLYWVSMYYWALYKTDRDAGQMREFASILDTRDHALARSAVNSRLDW